MLTLQNKDPGLPDIVYHDEFYNVVRDGMQCIRLSDGCFRQCWNCYAPMEKKFYPIPEIVSNEVIILDMNFLYAYPNPIETINKLGSFKVNNKKVYYDFWCGLDFTLLTKEIALALKKNAFGRFNNKHRFIYGLRIAWDRGFGEQKLLRAAIKNLVNAGYNSKNIQIFILANGRISYDECCRKLDLCKVWNVQVCDCWYDSQKRGKVQPIYWTDNECRDFGKRCRKHNQIIQYSIDPEWKKYPEWKKC